MSHESFCYFHLVFLENLNFIVVLLTSVVSRLSPPPFIDGFSHQHPLVLLWVSTSDQQP